MDNGNQIQQTNLVSDDTAAAMDIGGGNASQTTVEPSITQPSIDPIPTGSAADPTAPAIVPAPVSSDQVSPTPTVPSSSETESVETPADTVSPAAPLGDDAAAISFTDSLTELDDIKRSALNELKPLIEHVEQEPEERFETIMMMIRSNDDPKLIPKAYEAAKGIDDEKKRASALLNIVSEIEYLKSKA